MDVLGRLDPKTGKITEYPFPHSENTIRELFRDSEGRMWYGSPSNNRVGYFYLTGGETGAGKKDPNQETWRIRIEFFPSRRLFVAFLSRVILLIRCFY